MPSFMRYLVKLATFFYLIHAGALQANILISPTKIIFNDRVRTQQIYLVNHSSKMQTYRLGWQENTALETGGYKTLGKEESKSFNRASSMIRFSPKQVTLKPNGKQTVKLAVRRPKDLKEGEYRSHLLLKALPPRSKGPEDSQTLSLKMNILLSYELPIVVRQGVGITKAAIDNIELRYNKKNKNTEIKVFMSKEGLYSLNGNLIVYWKPLNGSEEVIVARVHDFTVYHELNHVIRTFTWKNSTPAAGTLRVAYEGRRQDKGEIIAESVIEVTPSLFSPI